MVCLEPALRLDDPEIGFDDELERLVNEGPDRADRDETR
jgi:hypothetical protein